MKRDDITAIGLMKELLPDDKAVRVFEYANRHNLEEDNQIFFFMALFEAFGRMFYRICDSIDGMFVALTEAGHKATEINDTYRKEFERQVRVIKVAISEGDRLAGRQIVAAADLNVKLDMIVSRLAKIEREIADTALAWQDVKGNLDKKLAYAATTQRFDEWFALHVQDYSSRIGNRIDRLIEGKLWVAYLSGGTLAVVNLMLAFFIVLRLG